MGTSFVLKGNICYSQDPQHLSICEQGYLVCIDGKSAGVYEQLPKQYENLSLQDYGDCMIIPGLIDLHLHAPQYTFRSVGMDLELLDWLEAHTFPEEAKYRDAEYARNAYTIFADDLKASATTRACMFGTVHRDGTEILMELMEATGLKTMVGKVNMDRNAPDYLTETSAEESARETQRWLEEIQGRFPNTQPILTPRFIPSCSDELLEKLGELQRRYNLPVQSHLSENKKEIAWVQELCPWSRFYGDAYDRFGLFGGNAKTIMAHCVWSSEEELQLMKENGVFVAHCPESNSNIASGISPARIFLQRDIPIGLGSDIAGGTVLSIFFAMAEAIRVSQLRWRLVDDRLAPLTTEEAFYMATKGGGAFFGKVGSFENDYELDALVLDDSRLKTPLKFGVKDRLERFLYLSDERDLRAKFVAGNQIF